MKIKTIIACLLALVLAMPAGDAYAQTRKKSTGTRKTATTGTKKTATTGAKKTATTKTAAAKTLNKADIEESSFIGSFMIDGLEKIGKDVGIYNSLFLFNDGKGVFWRIFGDKIDDGSWSISGTTLSVTAGACRLKLTTTDGFTFKGTLTNVNKGGQFPIVFYKREDGKYDPESLNRGFRRVFNHTDRVALCECIITNRCQCSAKFDGG